MVCEKSNLGQGGRVQQESYQIYHIIAPLLAWIYIYGPLKFNNNYFLVPIRIYVGVSINFFFKT